MRERSLERITMADLRRLGEIAIRDIESLFARRPKLRPYRERLFAIALCQGAALHHLDGKNGVKDFDVWCFFSEHPLGPFPYRRRGVEDFGDPRFGRTPGFEQFVGRRVDVLGRSIPVSPEMSPEEVLRGYLTTQSTASARALAEKAVVLIWPTAQLGRIVWPVPG